MTQIAVSLTASPVDHLRVAAANGDQRALAELCRRGGVRVRGSSMTAAENRRRVAALQAENVPMRGGAPGPAVVSTGTKRRRPGSPTLVTQGQRVA